MNKKCNNCHNILDITYFYKSSKGFLDSLCKKCRKEYSKKWKAKNPKTLKNEYTKHANKKTKANTSA